MSYQVYRIDSYDADSNSHSIGIRNENWFLRPDKIFQEEESAKEYVRNQNRKTSMLPNYLISLHSEEEKEAFVDTFCFSDHYLSERKYFLGLPSTKQIISQLRQSGINVVK